MRLERPASTVGRLGLAATLSTVSLVACTCAPRFDNCRYIALGPVPGVSIERRGKPSRAHLATTIPTRYSLERAAYRVLLEVPIEACSPVLEISVEGKDGASLVLFLNPPRLSGRYASDCAQYWHPEDAKPNQGSFAWRDLEFCRGTALGLSFDVIDQAGHVVGEEDIPFSIGTNGFVYSLDGA